jgi:hypothetical protein
MPDDYSYKPLSVSLRYLCPAYILSGDNNYFIKITFVRTFEMTAQELKSITKVETKLVSIYTSDNM